MRVKQWIKNLLLFVPLTLAHKFDVVCICLIFLAFVSFSLCASSIYIINDICDVENDRQHPIKKNRPLALNRISLNSAILLFVFCISTSLFLSFFLPTSFQVVLFIYLILSIVYSAFLKKVLFIDVLIVTFLYILRLMAGSQSISIELSNWFIGFSGFLFLGLVLLKRSNSLSMHTECQRLPGRSYIAEDKVLLEIIATCSGFASFVIISLYIESLKALTLYQCPNLLWCILPLMIYWYCRILILSHRGVIDDDLIQFVSYDKITYVIAALSLIVLIAAI